MLAIVTGVLLIGFGGVTDRLIPLYAVGAFLAFTLSQAGMLVHWQKAGGTGAGRKMLVNGLGALATGGTVVVVIVAKFTEGAWITVVTIPAILLAMYGIRRHYDNIQQKLASPTPLDLTGNRCPIVVLPLQQWSKIAKNALCAAIAISTDIRSVYVAAEDAPDDFPQDWHRNVVEPARAAGATIPDLIVLKSPFRFVVTPIVDYVIKLSCENPDRRIVAIVPELVENSWHNYLLHSHRATVLKTLLLLKGNDQISVLNVPWYFK